MFENYKDALFNEKIIRLQQRFRNYNHKVYTEEGNKIALSSNDDKRMQTYDKVTTFLYEQTYLKCARMKCYQKINNMLIKSLLIKINRDIIVTIQISNCVTQVLEGVSTAKISKAWVGSGLHFYQNYYTFNSIFLLNNRCKHIYIYF